MFHHASRIFLFPVSCCLSRGQVAIPFLKQSVQTRFDFANDVTGLPSERSACYHEPSLRPKTSLSCTLKDCWLTTACKAQMHTTSCVCSWPDNVANPIDEAAGGEVPAQVPIDGQTLAMHRACTYMYCSVCIAQPLHLTMHHRRAEKCLLQLATTAGIAEVATPRNVIVTNKKHAQKRRRATANPLRLARPGLRADARLSTTHNFYGPASKSCLGETVTCRRLAAGCAPRSAVTR